MYLRFLSFCHTQQRAYSVQFSPAGSRWYLCARKNPYALHPISQKFPQSRLWSGSNVRLIDDGPLSSFQGRSSSAFLPRLSPPGDRWCDVLGFVPAGSFYFYFIFIFKSSSTLQIFREASHLWGLLCPPVYLLSHFPALQHVQGNAPTGVFQGGCQPSTHSSLGFPFPFSLFVASSLNL